MVNIYVLTENAGYIPTKIWLKKAAVEMSKNQTSNFLKGCKRTKSTQREQPCGLLCCMYRHERSQSHIQVGRNASRMTIIFIGSWTGNSDLLTWACEMRFFSWWKSSQNHSYVMWCRPKGSASTGLANINWISGSWSAVLLFFICSVVGLGLLCTRGNLDGE